MDNNILQALAAMLRGGQQPNPQMLGSGAASQAAQIMQSQPYRAHLAEAKAMGEQPLSPEQFMAQMSAKPQ